MSLRMLQKKVGAAPSEPSAEAKASVQPGDDRVGTAPLMKGDPNLYWPNLFQKIEGSMMFDTENDDSPCSTHSHIPQVKLVV